MKKGKVKIVIKFGGEITATPDSMSNLAHSLTTLHSKGFQIILVHGGGPIATELGKKLGIDSKMVGGRRVTCPQTLEVMKMTLPGIVNSDVLSKLKAAKLPAIATSAISYIEAIKRPPKAVSGSDGQVVEFGAVGDVLSTNPTLINYMLEGGYIPVVSPLCSDHNGNILNINADTIAVRTAQAINASRLVLITQVGGVFSDLHDPASKLSLLTKSSAQEMIKKGVIQGGMIPKLEESFTLLDDQLKLFHITGLKSKDSLAQEIDNPGSQGTAVTK
jgi:acetylglutamate kinase